MKKDKRDKKRVWARVERKRKKKRAEKKEGNREGYINCLKKLEFYFRFFFCFIGFFIDS